MLQNLREHAQGWIAGVIVGILCLAFALWGIEYYLGGNQKQTTVAKVNGEEITQQQVDSLYKRLRQQAGESEETLNFNEAQQKSLKAAALQKLINQTVLSQAALKEGYVISNQQIGSIIAQIPTFQVNGQFSQPLFQRIITALFQTEQSFFADVKQNAVALQVKMGIAESDFLLPNELERAVMLTGQKRDFSYLTIPAAQFLKTTAISDQAITDYYKSHQQTFMLPEQVKIAYIMLSAKDFSKKITLTDQEIAQYYADNKAAFSTPEQWQIAQIVINVSTDADQKTVAAAQAKIADLAQRLQKNEDFAKLAMQYSDNKNTAIAGGVVGWVDRAKQAPEMVQVVAPLQPGQTSTPFRTAQGFSIVKLLAIKAPEVKPLALARQQVVDALQQQKTEQLLSEQSDQLTNLTYTNPDTLKPASDSLKLPIQTSEFFTRQGTASGITANPKLVAVAFSGNVLKQGNNSDLISLDDQTAVVLRVAAYKPAAVRPLSEVKATIIAQLQAQAAQNAAQALGEKIIADLKKGASMTDIAAKNQLTWTHKQQVGRQATDVATQILTLAFKLSPPTPTHPTYGGVSLPNNDYAVLAVTHVDNGSSATTAPAEQQMLQKSMAGQFGLLDYYLYTAEKMRQAKLTYTSN